MGKPRRIGQLELEGFADLLKDAEDGGDVVSAPTMAEIREREAAARVALKEKLGADGEIPSWADDYHMLINSGFPWKVAAFIAWSLTLKTYRWPETLDSLAVEVLGLSSARRIFEWRRKYPYIDQVIADLRTAKYFEYIPGAIAASGEVASIPDYKSTAERRLLFEATGVIETRQKVSVEEGGTLGAGRKLLDRLRKNNTAALLDMLGDDAQDLIDELEQELSDVEKPESAAKDEAKEA